MGKIRRLFVRNKDIGIETPRYFRVPQMWRGAASFYIPKVCYLKL